MPERARRPPQRTQVAWRFPAAAPGSRHRTTPPAAAGGEADAGRLGGAARAQAAKPPSTNGGVGNPRILFLSDPDQM